MLITSLANKFTKPGEYSYDTHKPSRARQVAFGADILVGIALIILGVLAMKGKIPDISSMGGSKILAVGALYSLINVVGIHYLIKALK